MRMKRAATLPNGALHAGLHPEAHAVRAPPDTASAPRPGCLNARRMHIDPDLPLVEYPQAEGRCGSRPALEERNLLCGCEGLFEDLDGQRPVDQHDATALGPDRVHASRGVADHRAGFIGPMLVALRPLEDEDGFRAGVAMARHRGAGAVFQKIFGKISWNPLKTMMISTLLTQPCVSTNILSNPD